MTASVALKTVETQFALETSSLTRQALEASIDAACRKIAPLWPLKHFVAVNPFLGFADRSFAETSAILRRIARIDMLAPHAFYREAIASGVIDDSSLEAALATAPCNTTLPRDLQALKAKAREMPKAFRRPPGVFTTVAELLDALADGDRQGSLVGFMIDRFPNGARAISTKAKRAGVSPCAIFRPMPPGARRRFLTAIPRSWASNISAQRSLPCPRIRSRRSDSSSTSSAFQPAPSTTTSIARCSISAAGPLCAPSRLEQRASWRKERYAPPSARHPHFLWLWPLSGSKRRPIS